MGQPGFRGTHTRSCPTPDFSLQCSEGSSEGQICKCPCQGHLLATAKGSWPDRALWAAVGELSRQGPAAPLSRGPIQPVSRRPCARVPQHRGLRWAFGSGQGHSQAPPSFRAKGRRGRSGSLPASNGRSEGADGVPRSRPEADRDIRGVLPPRGLAERPAPLKQKLETAKQTPERVSVPGYEEQPLGLPLRGQVGRVSLLPWAGAGGSTGPTQRPEG